MKKIVALVLSLVMALSLCTVAFGATGTTLYGVDGNKNVDKDVEHTVELSYYKANTADKYIGFYLCKWDADTETYLIPCTQDDAEAAIHKNGKLETFVFTSEQAVSYDENGILAVPEDAKYDATAKAQGATTALPSCTVTQYKEDGYVDADGCFYYVFDNMYDTKLNVNGKIVFATEVCGDTDYVIPASHIFAKGVANAKTGYDVCTCLICKGEFACTNNDEVATNNNYKISSTFEYKSAEAADVYDANAYDNGYDFKWGQEYATNYAFVWQLKAGTTEEIGTADKTETTTTGVESAKTFDAGIAMYVGMSLMSVAGTAVVIGKKKEF